MLWADKHRPLTLDSMTYHKDLSQHLKRMCESGDFPHILMYGPSGAGKKTRVMALLRQSFGPTVEKLKVENRIFKFANSSTGVELATVGSSHHIEITPSDAGNSDRLVVQELIKEIAQSQPLATSSDKDKVQPFKVVILNEVDRLSKEAQHALRRTMEKYMATCRIILCCTTASKVIEPVRSRCLLIRVGAPTLQEIIQALQSVARKENLTLPESLAQRIAEASDRNLRRAILMLEACKVQQYPFTNDQQIPIADWERFIQEIARDILDEQSSKRLYSVRQKLYELLVNCVPSDIIFKRLTMELVKSMDAQLQTDVVSWAAHYEYRCQLGQKPIFHLEAFVARVMAIYKGFLVSMVGAFD
eukprot:tig00000704_g3335.t1